MAINWNIDTYREVGSTQDLAINAFKEGRGEGVVIHALSQAKGRGRHGNNWASPIGNLSMSLIVEPPFGFDKAGQLSFVVAVAAADYLSGIIETDKHDLRLKWPNDILVNGLKLSGILLESEIKDGALKAIIIGCGMNVFNKQALSTCLNDLAEEPVYINKVRDGILDAFALRYEQWKAEGFDQIREDWLARAYGMGEAVTARLPNESHKGVFKDISNDGALIMIQEDGVERIVNAATVHFGEDAA